MVVHEELSQSAIMPFCRLFVGLLQIWRNVCFLLLSAQECSLASRSNRLYLFRTLNKNTIQDPMHYLNCLDRSRKYNSLEQLSDVGGCTLHHLRQQLCLHRAFGAVFCERVIAPPQSMRALWSEKSIIFLKRASRGEELEERKRMRQ